MVVYGDRTLMKNVCIATVQHEYRTNLLTIINEHANDSKLAYKFDKFD